MKFRLNMKQWWTAVFLSFPAELVCGVADGCVQGCCMSTARLRMSNHSAFCFLPLASSHLYDPPAWHGTYVVSNLVFNVFFSVTVPASCRSQGYHGYLMRLTRLVWWLHLLSSRTIPQDHLLLMSLTRFYATYT